MNRDKILYQYFTAKGMAIIGFVVVIVIPAVTGLAWATNKLVKVKLDQIQIKENTNDVKAIRVRTFSLEESVRAQHLSIELMRGDHVSMIRDIERTQKGLDQTLTRVNKLVDRLIRNNGGPSR